MKANEIRSGKFSPKSVSLPIPWNQGDPTPPDIYDDYIIVMLDNEPIRCVVGYNGEVKYNLHDEEEIVMLAQIEKERLSREASEVETRWIGPGEIVGRAAMAQCPDDMCEEQKISVGKSAAFSAGFVGTLALINGLKRLLGMS